MKPHDITKRSTLLATIRSEFPKSTAQDLEDELHSMIEKALSLPDVVGQSEQLVLFADWLQYHAKWQSPEAQVKSFLKEQKQN
jgi:hypothetical protein